jgi:putative glutamine amidotransferase
LGVFEPRVNPLTPAGSPRSPWNVAAWSPRGASNAPSVKIGLSYDQGTPEYRLYTGALMAAAEESNIDVQTFWIAGADRPFNETGLLTVDAMVLTGGADVDPARYGKPEARALATTYPGRDEAEWTILTAAFARRLPILAICRGMQLFNVYRGGTLIPDIPNLATHMLPDDARHPIAIEAGTSLALLTGSHEGEVTSSHHQAVDQLGRGLSIAARHADGTIEAIEWTSPMRKPWLAAVQWHPERMGPDEPLAHTLFRGFLQATAVSHV